MKKGVMFFILSTFLILLGGCETIKGAFEGAKRDWQSARKIDQWMRENLW